MLYVRILALEKDTRCSISMEREKVCAHCGVIFGGMPSALSKRKFCSKACVGASRVGVRKKEWASLNCAVCGKAFQVTAAWVRNGRRKYCSKTCHGLAHRGKQPRLGIKHTDKSRALMSANIPDHKMENSSQWKGGRSLNSTGYIMIMVDILPEDMRILARQMVRSPKQRYILEHRIVAASAIGRPLEKSEVVHHRNGIKNDNSPTNLEVGQRSAHSIHHRHMEKTLAIMEKENESLRAELSDLRLRLSQYQKTG
jgi:hypothetical protein